MQRILIAIPIVLLSVILLLPNISTDAQDSGDRIQLDERKLGEISAGNPQPTYIFSAEVNQSVTIDLTAISPQLALSFTVLAPNGALVVAVGNPSEKARITDTLIFPTAGDYTIQISNVSDVEGQFILSLFRPAPDVPAVPLLVGDEYRDFLTQGDKVVFGVTAVEESHLELSVMSADSRFGLDINLEDETGETVAFVSNSILGAVVTLPAGNMNYLLTLTNNHPTGEAINYTVRVNFPGFAGNVQVVTSTPEPEASPSPTEDGTPDLPVLPETGPCVLATRGQIVNVRSGPSTDYDTVTTIGAYTIYDVLGRNEDGTWFQINAVPEVGWVAASVTRQGGECDSLVSQSYLPLPGSISGTIWNDVCNPPDADSEPESLPEGCVEVGLGEYEADGIKAAAESGISGVEVTLLEGSCSGVAATPLRTTVSGTSGYTFDDLPPGLYCVSVNAISPTNASILIPGKWTAPRISTGIVQSNVTVEPGQNRTANFGWDFELSP